LVQRLELILTCRWAAKEAIIKASSRKIYMKDIVIFKAVDGGPVAVVLDQPDSSASSTTDSSSSIGQVLSAMNGQIVLLSISHEADYAVATALVPTSI
jgi:phosphopantetheinyl transferase (holo-ACP synthase)